MLLLDSHLLSSNQSSGICSSSCYVLSVHSPFDDFFSRKIYWKFVLSVMWHELHRSVLPCLVLLHSFSGLSYSSPNSHFKPQQNNWFPSNSDDIQPIELSTGCGCGGEVDESNDNTLSVECVNSPRSRLVTAPAAECFREVPSSAEVDDVLWTARHRNHTVARLRRH